MDKKTIADQVIERLAIYLGPHTAKNAVKTFNPKKLNRNFENLDPTDLPELLSALLPMLRTLIGRQAAESLVARIREEVKP